MHRSLLIILALASLAPVAGAEIPHLVAHAFAVMEETLIDDWTYTVTSRDSDGLMVERHVASRSVRARWQLLSKDGLSPTARDLARYADIQERRERERVERATRGENVLASMIEPGSLTLLDETATRATYSFRMNASHAKAGRFAEHLRGVMTVDKTVPYVDFVELRSVDDIRAATGVRLDRFEMTLRFARHEATGAIVPASIRTKIHGRAFLVKEIDEDSEVVFSDFAAPGWMRAEKRDVAPRDVDRSTVTDE